MIRKQVENLRGLVLTPEELDFIKPILVKSLEMNTQVTLMNGAGDVLEEIPVHHINPVPQWQPVEDGLLKKEEK